MQHTITVLGTGKLFMRPNYIRLHILISNWEEEWQHMMEASVLQTDLVRDAIESLGFKRSELKTLSFSTKERYETYRNGNEEIKKRLIGYEFIHDTEIYFPMDNAVLGRLLYKLTHLLMKPKIEIEYTVEDKDSATKQVMELAVLDAKKKAEILTGAAGVRLGNLVSIQYGEGNYDFVVRPMEEICYNEERLEDKSYDLDIEPEDISLMDTVQMVWEIHNG